MAEEREDVGERKCFLISQIGDLKSDIRQRADDFLEYIVRRCPAIEEFKYRVKRADHLNEPGRITSQVMRAVLESDLVIADVTGENPNVYYELSLRHAIGKPLVICAEDGTSLPFDTREHRTVFYAMHSRRAETARDELAKQIRSIHENGFKPENPIADAAGVVQLANSGERGQVDLLDALDRINSRLSSLENGQRLAAQNQARRDLVSRESTVSADFMRRLEQFVATTSNTTAAGVGTGNPGD